MAEYRKYMFDNFVIGGAAKKVASSDEPPAAADDNIKQTATEVAAPVEEEVTNDEEISIVEPEPEEEYTNTPMSEFMFSQDDLDDAVAKAKEEAYAQGLLAAQNNDTNRQNTLLEEIKNQLSLVFAESQQSSETQELNALRFLAAALHKLLPSLEKIDSISEIKQFLDDNFAQLSSQKSLAFFFHPDAAKQAAPLIEKLAAHHDFEGKISIHKDDNLGLSDCRIEWKDGYAERNTAKLLEKLQELLNNNQQERENG